MRNYSKRFIIMGSFWIIVGIALITLSLLGIIEEAFYSGMGGGILAVGILQLIKGIKLLNPDKEKEMSIEAKDERNLFISTRSWAFSGYTFVICACILGLVLRILNVYNEVSDTLFFSVCFIICVYYFCYLIFRKKY